jgi:alpha-methylacyl-CoA racemase
MTMIVGLRKGGLWSGERSDNVIDGGAPYYSTYETADGGWVAIGPIEGKFYGLLLEKLGLSEVAHMRPQNDRTLWGRQRETFASVFAAKTRAEWCALLERTDVCFAPVLTMDEAPDHPHIRAREAYIGLGDVRQPAPQPRLTRTPAAIAGPPAIPGQHTTEVLRNWGWSDEQIRRDLESGAVFQAEIPDRDA